MSVVTRISNLLINSANRKGLHIMRAYRIPQTTINLLTICIPALLFKKESIFFLQIGASDGVTDDPLFELVKKYQLKGLCVEPLPEPFEQLKKNYQGITDITFENAAISDINGEIFLYTPINQASAIALSQKSSTNEQVLRRHGFGEDQIAKVAVKSITFSTLAAKHNLLNIDLLQIDTEGADYNILKMVFEAGFFPKIIHYESIHLNQHDQENCRDLLTQNDYKYIETSKDTLAVQSW